MNKEKFQKTWKNKEKYKDLESLILSFSFTHVPKNCKNTFHKHKLLSTKIQVCEWKKLRILQEFFGI